MTSLLASAGAGTLNNDPSQTLRGPTDHLNNVQTLYLQLSAVVQVVLHTVHCITAVPLPDAGPC